MNYFSTIFIALSMLGLASSCGTTIYKDKAFDLRELNIKITLPANTKIQYDGPSYLGDLPRYDMSYNDGNSDHNTVEISFEKKNNGYPNSLAMLKETIEAEGGVILDEYHYENGFLGYSYQQNASRLFQFISDNPKDGVYVIVPNNTYNNRHQYFSVVLKAVESIEFGA